MNEEKVQLSQELIALINSQSEDYWFKYVLKSKPHEIKEKITEDYILSRGLNLHLDIYEQEQEVPTIIFIHGTSVYSRFYADFLYKLWLEGLRIIALDLQGHGRSEGRRGDFTIKQLVENIYNTASYVFNKYKSKIGIMGSSLGGILSLYATANDSRINSCICHNAAIFNEMAHKKIVKGNLKVKLLKPFIPFFAKLMPNKKFSVWTYLDLNKLISLEDLKEMGNYLLNDNLLADKYTLRSVRTQMIAPLAKPIEEISTPIMIINGDNDYLFSVEYMTEIFERITSKKKLEIIPNSGHLIFQEKIEESLQRTLNWFNETLY